MDALFLLSYAALHLAVKLVPDHEIAFLEESQTVGKGVKEHVEALRELLRPGLSEVDQAHWAVSLPFFRFHF